MPKIKQPAGGPEDAPLVEEFGSVVSALNAGIHSNQPFRRDLTQKTIISAIEQAAKHLLSNRPLVRFALEKGFDILRDDLCIIPKTHKAELEKYAAGLENVVFSSHVECVVFIKGGARRNNWTCPNGIVDI